MMSDDDVERRLLLLEAALLPPEQIQHESQFPIPDGYEQPSDQLDVCQQQYADAVTALAKAGATIKGYAEGWSSVVIHPPKIDLAVMVGLPLLYHVAAELEQMGNCTDCRPGIDSGLAKAVLAFVAADPGAAVAASEFARWAQEELVLQAADGSGGLPQLILANLNATGLWE